MSAVRWWAVCICRDRIRLYSGWHRSKERQQQMKLHSQLVCAAVYMKHVGFRSGQCVFFTSPNIWGITFALRSRFVRVPTLCSGTKVPEFQRDADGWTDILCLQLGNQTSYLLNAQKLRRKLSKGHFERPQSLEISLSPHPPQAVIGLSKTLCTQILQYNSSDQQRKSELSTLRQCPAARVFCLTKYFIYTHDMKEWLTTFGVFLLVF